MWMLRVWRTESESSEHAKLERCPEDYKALGLKAVVGGKLTPSRNKALDDAAARH